MGSGTKSPTRRHKGCAMCKSYKWTGAGLAKKKSWAELKSLGKRRRITRKDIGDDNG